MKLNYLADKCTINRVKCAKKLHRILMQHGLLKRSTLNSSLLQQSRLNSWYNNKSLRVKFTKPCKRLVVWPEDTE